MGKNGEIQNVTLPRGARANPNGGGIVNQLLTTGQLFAPDKECP